MKKVLVYILVIPFFFSSCSTEDETAINKHSAIAIKETVGQKSTTTPENTANPYDAAGQLRNQVLDAAIALNPAHTTVAVATATDNTAIANSGFTAISQGYPGLNTTRVDWVVTNSSSTQTVINSTLASTAGKQQLTVFMSLMEGLDGKVYDDVYTAITVFEQAVISNTLLTALDRQIILVTTSVARYQYYRDGNDKDRWSLKRTNLLGAMTGAGSSQAMGTTMAVASFMAQ